jgi:hypothetical protein
MVIANEFRQGMWYHALLEKSQSEGSGELTSSLHEALCI